VLADHVAERAEIPFAQYVREAVREPLAIGLDSGGDPGSGMHGSLDDVLAIGRELLSPRLVADETRDEMTSVQFPGLSGVLPDHGRFDPLDWGLGVQLNTRPATWMGERTSPRTFGHFGGTGTFLWVDPDVRVVCAAITTREFGSWAKEAWSRLADAVLDELVV
jgi:CubicO group peptidase (beta-lactamase class C family)